MDNANERLACLVPSPRSYVQGSGTLRLRWLRPHVDAPRELHEEILDRLRLLPLPLDLTDGDGTGTSVRVELDPGRGNPEEYRLRIFTDRIEVAVSDLRGLVHAVHTMKQLLPAEALRTHPDPGVLWDLPVVDIDDGPRFGWRGVLIDVARHFMPKHELLRHIALAAEHKFNRVQLHLTDDQGWRIESAVHPRLHEVGSSRRETQLTHFDDAAAFDGTPHGGYYTQDDLREIVRFAARRGITIVPEVELPGHTGALLAAYPHLGSPALPERSVFTTFGVHDTLINPGPATMEFLAPLLHEIADIFDSPWVHIGADESLLDSWATDPAVLHHADARGLTRPAEIFAAFVADVEDLLARVGRTMVTWDDSFATQATAPGDRATAEVARQVVMAWRGADVARRAVAAGYKVVLAPVLPAYFDFAQSDDDREPLAIGGPVTLGEVAGWQPIPPEWTEAERSQVLGVQCQLWTEYIRDPRHADYMLYPRACVFAEVAWSGTPAEPETVLTRLPLHLRRLDAAGVGYRPLSGPLPWQQGGTGWRAYRPSESIAEIEAQLSDAAVAGVTAWSPPAVSDT